MAVRFFIRCCKCGVKTKVKTGPLIKLPPGWWIINLWGSVGVVTTGNVNLAYCQDCIHKNTHAIHGRTGRCHCGRKTVYSGTAMVCLGEACERARRALNGL